MTATATAPTTFASGGPRPAPATLNRLFFDSIARFSKPNAVQFKSGGAYRPMAHATIEQRVRHVAFGLEALGVRPGDRVAIISENRPEWLIADYACLTSGVTDVPIYPTLTAEQMRYILHDAGAKLVFVQNEMQAAKVAQIRAELPELTTVVGFDANKLTGADLTFAELERRGAERDGHARATAYREAAMAVTPDALATLIYTSGTTGEPKGAMLTHGNIASNVVACTEVLRDAIGVSGGDNVTLSFLPLSHILQRMFDYLMWAGGISIAYAESMDAIIANLGEVKPTIVVAVPRVYEKIYARVLENALAGSAIKKRIFFWARGVGDRWADQALRGTPPGGLLGLQYRVAARLVFSKLKQRVGGRLKYFVSGGAPLAPEINKFFFAAGLVILEGYGLTETSPVIAVNTPKDFRIGTVGKLIPGAEVRIAPDGEILTRGPNVMAGYFNKPQATTEAIDADGWFHTGDIGTLEDGFLRITDRKKDIIVTAGGKNIAPQPIENTVKTNKFIVQAVMIGDKRKYPVMLVVPNFDQLEPWAKEQGLLWSTRAQLLTLPQVKAKMEEEVLGQCKALAKFERPKRLGLLENDFTVESGELTPSLKVKRRVVDRNYKALIDSLYEEEAGE